MAHDDQDRQGRQAQPAQPGPFVEIHPDDATRLQICDTDPVEIASRRGRAVLPAVVTDRVLPEMGAASIRVLQACGCEVTFPQEQHCCGLVALNSGDRPRGQIMAEQTIAMLEGVQADWIVTG